jgi:carbamoyl-phosphate synthase large subunit
MYSNNLLKEGIDMNILVCSAGRRVKLVKYFKEELGKIGGKIVAVDCDSTAPALYFADIWEVVPRIGDPEYIPRIKELCVKHQIKGILSLIDPELTLLAEYKDEFMKENIKILVSDKEIVDICFDKYSTYKFMEKNNISAVPTYISLPVVLDEIKNEHLHFPLIVKPRAGSASFGMCKVNSIDELILLMNDSHDLIVQPYIKGNEYGIDCYIDLINNHAVNIFCKRKIRMRAGETDKSESVKDRVLIKMIKELINTLKPVGPIDIDCFKTESGYAISEINPRFGGGYPHAHESGQNFVKNIINNLLGVSNDSQIGNYQEGSVMIKFDEVMIINTI